MAALCLAFFVEMVDNTLLSIALPTIGRDLGSGTTALQWVTGAYSLTFGGLLLTSGSIADRLGRRRVLLVGLAVFGVLSLAVVFVHTTGQLIALRAGPGIAAAAMALITNSLVFRLFDDKALRMRAMTVMISVGLSGSSWAAARRYRAGACLVGVAAGGQRPDRADRRHRRPPGRRVRSAGGPERRQARPAGRRV